VVVQTIAVLGPGGVGGFVAAALTRAGYDATVVAQEPTSRLIDERGILVKSVRLGDFVARPRTTAHLEGELGTLIVATKASGLEAALERIAAVPELVVPLLNGLDHMHVLRERFGAERVAAGTIRIEADRPQPGVIIQTSPFLRVDLAADHPPLRPQLEGLAVMLEDAEVPTRIEQSEKQILWSKLVRLNALACTTSAIDRQIGFIRSDPEWRAALIGCIEEGAAVAHADGAEIDPGARLAELDEAHPELGSSMQRDIAAGRAPELDAIPGAILRAGARLGIECPTIARLAREIALRAGVPAPVV
jgi:2-dehydropantoate 2-reductase